jgi:hypothetical protein
MELQNRLMALARYWVAAHADRAADVSLQTLSSRATSDGKLFRRLGAGRPMYVGTLERAWSYLAAPENWPSGCIPQAAADILHAPLHGRALLPGRQSTPNRIGRGS